MKKRVLVFGAAGFMGSYLTVELVSSGYDVIASDYSAAGESFYAEKQIEYVKIDITNKESFNSLLNYDFDAVIHLAATQPANVSAKAYDPRDYVNVNVLGTLNILEFCRARDIKKLIYASSHRNTQGFWINDKAVKEEDGRALKYDGEYAMFSISESAAQDCVFHYNAQYGLNGIVFRLPPVYGYGPHTEIFKDGKQIKTGFQIFIDNAKSCKPIEVWGDSKKGRDIIYIKDVISAFVKALEKSEVKGLYNITSGKKLTLMEEAQTIAKVFWGCDNSPVIVERPEIDNNIDNFLYDINKAKKDLDWSPQYSFEEMLYDFIKEQKSNTYGYLLEKRKKMFE